jgi:excisionase family DNA binding protein
MHRADVVITRDTKFDQLPEYLTPEELGSYLGLGRGTAYDLLRRGEIPSIRLGRLIRVPKSALTTNTGTAAPMLRSTRRRD